MKKVVSYIIFSIFLLNIQIIYADVNIKNSVNGFKKILEDNHPGNIFKKTKYLAYEKKGSFGGKKVEKYIGALGGIQVWDLSVDSKSKKILTIGISLNINIYRNLLPILEKKYGRPISVSEDSMLGSLIKINNSDLDSFSTGTYEYKSGNFYAQLSFISEVRNMSGNVVNHPKVNLQVYDRSL